MPLRSPALVRPYPDLCNIRLNFGLILWSLQACPSIAPWHGSCNLCTCSTGHPSSAAQGLHVSIAMLLKPVTCLRLRFGQGASDSLPRDGRRIHTRIQTQGSAADIPEHGAQRSIELLRVAGGRVSLLTRRRTRAASPHIGEPREPLWLRLGCLRSRARWLYVRLAGRAASRSPKWARRPRQREGFLFWVRSSLRPTRRRAHYSPGEAKRYAAVLCMWTYANSTDRRRVPVMYISFQDYCGGAPPSDAS